MAISGKEEVEGEISEAGYQLINSPPSSITHLISTLHRIEGLLSRVEQSPAESMRNAISPLLKAMIAKEFLRHLDIDVKVAVASCISEITRITAPEAPYDDDQMKEVFQLIVSCFEKLDDRCSPSYIRRISILDTTAKVRSCVVMLDLECEALIVEMFQHFFRTIRSEHPENVFSSMVAIMTLVLEESEDVSVDLVSSILNVLRTDNKEVLPVARQLGEKVMEKCYMKIGPCLEKAMEYLHTTQDDYPKVVANLLKEGSIASKTRDAEAASKNAVDDNVVANEPTEKALEVAMETMDDAPEEKGVPSIVGSPKSVVSNGTIQKESEDTNATYEIAKETNKAEPHGEEAEPGNTKVENSVAEEPMKSLSEPEKVNKRKEPTETGTESEVPVPSPKTSDEPVDVPPPGEKKCELVEDVPADDLHSSEYDIKNSAEEARVSEPKSNKGTGEKVHSVTDKGDSAPDSADVPESEDDKTSELDAKSAKQSGKVQIGSQSEDKKKRGQGSVTTKDVAKSPARNKGKKSVGSLKSLAKPAKDESDVEKEPKSNSKRKRSIEKKAYKYGKELVGSKVQVWWPDDKKFYAGIVKHFDPSTKQHKITYDDGDVEVLKLENETWKLVDGSVSDLGDSSDGEISDDTDDETPKAKKVKMSPVVGSKLRKTEASAKKVGASSGKFKATSKSSNSNPSKGSNKSKQEATLGALKSKAKSRKSGSKSNGNSKADEAPSEEEEDEVMESSPEPVTAPGSSKGKSGSKSKRSSKKRTRSIKG